MFFSFEKQFENIIIVESLQHKSTHENSMISFFYLKRVSINYCGFSKEQLQDIWQYKQ